MQPSYLENILENLREKAAPLNITIPGLWLDYDDGRPKKVDFSQFLITRISDIIKTPGSVPRSTEGWTNQAVVYNLFVRLFTAYDHNQDGNIGDGAHDVTLNNEGIRETGTFLKTIALLPYLKRFGINTIHLLPITEIGVDGRKGDLGSPYAIKDPFKIDPNLADPIVNLPIEDQYKGLIEAAHHLGIRVVQEFIFRTAAIDSTWTNEHPNWFYWIKNDQKYGPPKFSTEDLKQILKVPKGKGKFIPPSKSYRKMFEIPKTGIERDKCKTAGAFADWPPNDLQPPWSDVTYLRLFNYDYKHKNNYNYIAYNTIRYYDPELAKEKHINQDLWDRIANIIPYYQQTFGVDGAMIDMGHALPNQLKSKIIESARGINPAFAFWDENFDNKKATKNEGYDAVIGDAWYKISKRNGFRNLIKKGLKSKPLIYFGAAETHNSPRLINENKKKAAWMLFNILPNAMPFLHNGFELDEQLPVNTGLNFTKQQIAELSHKKLALFYKTSLNWELDNITSYIRKAAELVKAYPWIFDEVNLTLLETSNKKILGYYKKNKHKEAFILFNTNFHKNEKWMFEKSLISGNYYDIVKDRHIDINNLDSMQAGQVMIGIKQIQKT